MTALNEAHDGQVMAPVAARGWRATFSSLENRNYRYYWLSTLASFTAMQMQLVIQGWLVYEISEHSIMAIGWVSIGSGIPMLLFSLLGGAIVDRVEKRNLLIVTQTLMGGATLIIAILISTGSIALWHLIIASVIKGTIFSFNMPGRQAIIPRLVEHRQLMNAIALGSGAMHTTRVIVPALGGVLAGAIGFAGAYYFMVACYIVATALMFMLPRLGVAPRDSNASMSGSIIEGLRYVRRSPALLGLMTMAFVPIILGMPYQTLMPVFASNVLDVGASGLGYLLSMAGVGALVSSLMVAYLGDFRRKGLLLLGASAFFGVFLVLFANSTSYLLSMILMVGVGAASAVYMASNNTLLQLNSDESMHGRVMGMFMMTVGLMPVGSLGAAAIAQTVGAPVAVGVGGAAIVFFTIAMSLFRPSLRRL